MEFNLEEFFADIGIVGLTFQLSDSRVLGQDRGGILQPVGLGVRYWFGSATVRPNYHEDADRIMARMNQLTETDGAFLVCPPSTFNVAETTGSIISINSSDRRIAQLSGVSVLDEGGWFGVEYDGKRSCHSVSSRSGTTVSFVPPLPLGVSTGEEVTFGRPAIRAVIEQGGVSPYSYHSVIADGLSFSWVQSFGVSA